MELTSKQRLEVLGALPVAGCCHYHFTEIEVFDLRGNAPDVKLFTTRFSG